jgi:hypothetical protein
MRYIVDEWPHSTDIEGPWDEFVLPVTSDVTVSQPFWSEFIGGSVVALEAMPRGQLLGHAHSLLCGMMGADGTWVLRAMKAARRNARESRTCWWRR